MTLLSPIVFQKPVAKALHPTSFQRPRLRAALRNACLFATAAVLVPAMFTIPSMAQNRSAADKTEGVQILLLGTKGGPPLDRDRSEPSSLLIVDGRPYLIDCGIGTMRRLLDTEVRSETIRTIFITHLHSDHDLGLVDVMANDVVYLDGAQGAAHTIDIYGPPQTAQFVKFAYSYIRIPSAVFAADGLSSANPANPFRTHEIDRAGLVYQDDKIRVTAAENTHYKLMSAKDRARMKSYAYRFNTRYGAIVFTGDTGVSDGVARLAKGADVLVSEVIDIPAIAKLVGRMSTQNHWTQQRRDALMAHMKFEHLPMKDVGEMATKAEVKSVVLHHYSPVEDAAIYVSGVKKYYSGPVFAGKDLARYCLGTPDASRAGAHTLRSCP
ncbi:MAG: MBL fold metallo-hydrolase [Candidatus Acidiferrales bacterium]